MRTTWATVMRADADALIREARRRQRIRYVLTTAACLAVLGTGAGLYASLHRSASPPHRTAKPKPTPVRSHRTMPPRIPHIAARIWRIRSRHRAR